MNPIFAFFANLWNSIAGHKATKPPVVAVSPQLPTPAPVPAMPPPVAIPEPIPAPPPPVIAPSDPLPTPVVVVAPPADHKEPRVVVHSLYKDGETMSNEVYLVATATSEKTITGWAIYCDSNLVYLNKVSKPLLDMTGLLPPGQRSIILRAWDSAGNFGDSSFKLNLVLDVLLP